MVRFVRTRPRPGAKIPLTAARGFLGPPVNTRQIARNVPRTYSGYNPRKPSMSLHPIQPTAPLGLRNNALANAKIVNATPSPRKFRQPPGQGRIEDKQRRNFPKLPAGHNQPVSARDYEGNLDLTSGVDVPPYNLEWRIRDSSCRCPLLWSPNRAWSEVGRQFDQPTASAFMDPRGRRRGGVDPPASFRE